MKYYVKTRNWYCKMWVRRLLDLSHRWGTLRGDTYRDGDGKFYLETNSKALAVFTWLYFMALVKLTGGWTYCIDTHKYSINELDGKNGLLV